VGCALSRNFEVLLIWRMIHGVAAACAVVTRSIIRDVYSGRAMARVMSLTYIVFMVVPIVAPGVGAAFLMLWPWRYIFVLFGSFAAVTLFWALARLPETLNPDDRLILSTSHIAAAARMALATPVSFGYTLAVTMTFGSILAYIAMAPQIFGVTFERASWMPAMFALCALSMSLASYLNSRIVERLGMRVISHAALLTFIAVTAVHLLVASLGYERMWTFVLLQSLTMGSVGLTASNFGAMAMEPVGAAAGVGASLQGFVTTFGAAIIAAVIGKAFDGSTVPLAAGSLCCGLAALGFVLVGERGRLFVQRAAAAQPQATVVYERHLE
jgi:DHA1 family bicyclomycin/chloramphenicol resistance-like MFS transporter